MSKRFRQFVTMSVLLWVAAVSKQAAAEVLDFYVLRETLIEETQFGKDSREYINGMAVIGTWARWRAVVDRVIESQDGLWLILVEMDEPEFPGPSHDLEVWTDDPAAALLEQGHAITVKGNIVDFRRLPGAVVRIVIDARI